MSGEPISCASSPWSAQQPEVSRHHRRRPNYPQKNPKRKGPNLQDWGLRLHRSSFSVSVFRYRNPFPARLTNRGSFIAGARGGFFDLANSFYSGLHRVILCFLFLVQRLRFFLASTVGLVWRLLVRKGRLRGLTRQNIPLSPQGSFPPNVAKCWSKSHGLPWPGSPFSSPGGLRFGTRDKTKVDV